MSAVTPEEVLATAARAFGVPLEELCDGAGAVRRPKLSWPRYARICTIALILRHTSAKKYQALRMFQGSKFGGGRNADAVGEQAAKVLEEFNQYAPLRALIAKCEDEIDALHERRTSSHASPIDEKVVRDLASGMLL